MSLARQGVCETLCPRQEVCKRWPQRPCLACLPLKLDGFSRPAYSRTVGSHRGLSARRTRKAAAAIHRTQKKRSSFSGSLHIFPTLKSCIVRLYDTLFYFYPSISLAIFKYRNEYVIFDACRPFR